MVRAVIALVLMVLFFAVAVAAVVGLLWLAKVLFLLLPDIRGRGIIIVFIAAAACAVAAVVVAWSVLPRPDRFEPPGPEITRAAQPALFAEIDRVATATQEAMPAHVYLVNEVNAFVAQRGGLMGLGSRRVMGIGVPLMRILSVSELRAVLAHEMGHFYGGDTRLGPWIYKTRGSMIRTVINLGKVGQESAEISQVATLLFIAVRAPFLWFGQGFLRVSQAVSRAQEYSADGVAVRTEGATALVEGLKKSHAAGLAHQIYLRNEVAPLVDSGVLPPIGEGFSRFLGSARVAGLLDQVVAGELEEGSQDPYDSHPPLRDRIAAAERVAGPATAPDPRSAIELVVDPEQYESGAIRKLVDHSLKATTWDDTGRVWLERWRKQVKDNRRALVGLEVAAVARTPRAVRDLAYKVHGQDVGGADDDTLRRWAVTALAAAFAVRLVELGYAVDSAPGAPHRLRNEATVVEPWNEVGDWLRGEGRDDAFAVRWAEVGLDGRPLA